VIKVKTTTHKASTTKHNPIFIAISKIPSKGEIKALLSYFEDLVPKPPASKGVQIEFQATVQTFRP
jgi:hypothetical protein